MRSKIDVALSAARAYIKTNKYLADDIFSVALLATVQGEEPNLKSFIKDKIRKYIRSERRVIDEDKIISRRRFKYPDEEIDLIKLTDIEEKIINLKIKDYTLLKISEKLKIPYHKVREIYNELRYTHASRGTI